MSLYEDTLSAVEPVDRSMEGDIRAHLDSLTKPPGSLGVLEDLAARYCLINGTTVPILGKKRIVTFAGDHGVADEGVSAYPPEVTGQMVLNMLSGGAAINVLGRAVGAEVCVVDIGVASEIVAMGLDQQALFVSGKVARGTANIAKGPAMTPAEAREAVEVGIGLAREAREQGVKLLGTGDMGIANTTPSAALFAALLPCDVEEITGRGTGIDDAGLVRKVDTIKRALEVNKARLDDPFGTLAALGGLEIAGIAGLIIGAAASRLPVVVDGFISSAGALAACRICPDAEGYMFFSHQSAEQGHRLFFERFEARPILDLGMRLGEGTGAALAMSVIESAVKIYNEMATFGDAGVSDKD
jgi:nicotinate-nucleotide--dimethylbenzimidazole phosphoribosyltransferase